MSRFRTVAQIKVKHVFDSKKCVSFVLELSKSFLFDLLFAFLQQTDVLIDYQLKSLSEKTRLTTHFFFLEKVVIHRNVFSLPIIQNRCLSEMSNIKRC